MSARHKNFFELKGRTIFASGQTLALRDIAAVRRKSEYRPRPAGLILLLCGLIMLAWGWRDETTQQQEKKTKFARDYANAEQQMSADPNSTAMDSVQPLDISHALQMDAQLKNWGMGLLGVGFIYAFVRRPRHHILVTTGGQQSSIYWAKTKAEANQIVEEIAAKMG